MFTIAGLDPAPFQHYIAMSDGELAALHARRVISDGDGQPCRVSLVDAAAGEELLLVHYMHHAVDTPYRASGPIYVRRAATRSVFVDEVPLLLRTRVLSLRAYDAAGFMREAAVMPGAELEMHVARMFADAKTVYLHAHYAQPGCFAARIDRRER